MSLLQELEADVKAGEQFLVSESEAILKWAAGGVPAVEKAFGALIDDAKALGATLLTAAQGSLSAEISGVEADFETAIANFIQRTLAGDPSQALLSALAANGVGAAADAVEALVKPLFVKVLSALVVPAPAGQG